MCSSGSFHCTLHKYSSMRWNEEDCQKEDDGKLLACIQEVCYELQSDRTSLRKLRKHAEINTVGDRPRSEKPRAASQRVDRALYRLVRLQRFSTLTRLREHTRDSCSGHWIEHSTRSQKTFDSYKTGSKKSHQAPSLCRTPEGGRQYRPYRPTCRPTVSKHPLGVVHILRDSIRKRRGVRPMYEVSRGITRGRGY